MAAAVLHAQQFLPALIELVVASVAEIKAHQVESHHRRLIVEQRREQRAGPDHVARRRP